MTDLPALKAEGSNKRPNVLLGITGSVAAVKGPELALRLSEFATSSFDEARKTVLGFGVDLRQGYVWTVL